MFSITLLILAVMPLLAAGPQAEVALGALGCMVSLNDLADRPPVPLADGQVLQLGTPLLLNIALHGLEEAAGVRYHTGNYSGTVRAGCPALTRYADDPACCYSRQQAGQVKAQLAGWLEPRWLAFNEAKTRIVSLSEGLDFLGVRHEAPSIRVGVKDRHRCAVAAAQRS